MDMLFRIRRRATSEVHAKLPKFMPLGISMATVIGTNAGTIVHNVGYPFVLVFVVCYAYYAIWMFPFICLPNPQNADSCNIICQSYTIFNIKQHHDKS